MHFSHKRDPHRCMYRAHPPPVRTYRRQIKKYRMSGASGRPSSRGPLEGPRGSGVFSYEYTFSELNKEHPRDAKREMEGTSGGGDLEDTVRKFRSWVDYC